MIQSKLTSKYRNRVLSALSPADLARLVPNLKPTQLELRKILERPNKRIERLYFIEHGAASVVASSDPTNKGEIGLIGREGVSGLAVLLGDNRSPHSTYMQLEGGGLSIDADAIRTAMARSPTLQRMLLRFAQSFMIQIAHTAVANANAPVEQRLARWLLMAHDRIDGNEIDLTHEFIALMIATRRAGVTDALGALVDRGLIRTGRKSIFLTNRSGLEKYAGSFYGTPEAEYDRLIERSKVTVLPKRAPKREQRAKRIA